MRIREFSIRRYGPLPDIGRILLGNFSLFFGKNEDGKTLTIDGLIKMLFRGKTRVFEKIDRVDEDPDGYLVLEDDGGKEIKFPQKGKIEDITGLSSSDCRNVFIIRDSDLSIAEESIFYRDVTDRLTGLRTKEISFVNKELQKLGILTRADSSAELSDDKSFFGDLRIKTRVKGAAALIKKIEKLRKEIKAENFDRVEEEILKIRESLEVLEQKLSRLEDTRKRKRYEEGKAALETILSSSKELEGLEVYNEKDKELYRDCERDMEIYKKEREKLKTELDEKKKELREKKEKWKEKERELQVLKGRKKKIDEEIKPEINSYQKMREDLAGKEAKNKFFALMAMIFAVLLAISILGIIISNKNYFTEYIRPQGLFYGLAIVFSILTGASGVFRFLFERKKAALVRMFEKIKFNTSKFRLDSTDIQKILLNIQNFSDDFSKKEDEAGEISGEKRFLEEEIKGIQEERLPEIETKIREAKKRRDEIKLKAEVETIKEYNEKLRLKQRKKKLRDEQITLLESHFGSGGKELGKKLSYWQKEIGEFEEFKNKAKEIEYSEKVVSELKKRKEGLLAKEEKIKGKMAGFREELREIERKANETLRLEEDYLYCTTSIELNAAQNKLKDFIEEIESKKDNVLEVMKIFEEIRAEEEKKVSDLFGKEARVSEYFYRITDGIYKEVEYSEEKKIQVRLKNGDVLDADKLSGGAYDQLYLSIRLALGEKLLKGGKGFFIMDDPFIKADRRRLAKQMDILKKISDSGWQILYFTAKDEVKDLLKEDVENGKVSYIEVQSIFS